MLVRKEAVPFPPKKWPLGSFFLTIGLSFKMATSVFFFFKSEIDHFSSKFFMFLLIEDYKIEGGPPKGSGRGR